MRIYKGDIFYADLTPVVGCEQGGIRPVLIVQNNIGNLDSPTVIVAAITSKATCSPCNGYCSGPCAKPFCMEMITVDEVYAVVKKFLTEKGIK